MQDHLGTVGLGDKIHGAVGQGVDLIGLTVALGHDDDRDHRQLVIGLDLIQEGIPVHNGHHHIQQDQGDAVRMLLQDLQRFLTVFRLQDGILFVQDLPQQLAVQLVVFHD